MGVLKKGQFVTLACEDCCQFAKYKNNWKSEREFSTWCSFGTEHLPSPHSSAWTGWSPAKLSATLPRPWGEKENCDDDETDHNDDITYFLSPQSPGSGYGEVFRSPS